MIINCKVRKTITNIDKIYHFSMIYALTILLNINIRTQVLNLIVFVKLGLCKIDICYLFLEVMGKIQVTCMKSFLA